MMFAPLLLMAASEQLPTTQTSPLASPETTHEWVLLSDDEEGIGWYDKTFEDTIPFERRIYPVVLIRFIFRGDDVENAADMLLAVDCIENQQAVVAGWLHAEDEVRALYDAPEGLMFDFARPPFDKEDIIIFKQACGADWTP